VPSHCYRMRLVDRDLIRGGHYGQRSCEPHQKAEHMAAPTNAAKREKSSCQHGAVHTCAGFRPPGCRPIHALRRPAARKAPRQEIAGCGAPTVQRALWGFGAGVSVGEVASTLSIGSLWLEFWVCVLARTSGSHVARLDLRCDHGAILLIGASGCGAGREPARMARFGAVLHRR
jgi:hypothetical protein